MLVTSSDGNRTLNTPHIPYAPLKHPAPPALDTPPPQNNETMSPQPEQKTTHFFAPDRVFIDRLNPNRLNMTINDQKLSLETRREVQEPGHMAESARNTRSVEDHEHTAPGKRPINLYIVIHEDLQHENRELLFNDHFSWLKTELEDISGREININFFSTHEMRKVSYKHEDLNTAGSIWAEEVEDLREKYGFAKDVNKFLLLTKDDIKEGISGIGVLDYAIAKAAHRIPAHEIGHMFGATHQDAEKHFNTHGAVISSIYGEEAVLDEIRKKPELRPLLGYQPSIMNEGDGIQQPQGLPLRFSKKNRENIRKYLSTIP